MFSNSNKDQTDFEWVSQTNPSFKKKQTELALTRSESFGLLTSPSSTTIFYRELKPLGTGAFGTVHKIVSTDKKHEAALKTQKSTKLTETARAESEAKFMDLVNGETYHYNDKDIKVAYTMMKLLYADWYHRYLEDKTAGFKSINEFILLFINLAKVVAYLHKVLGIVHCDLKLANICHDDATGKIYLYDFGLTRYITDPTAGSWNSNCWHLPSETKNAIPAHPSIDIYSLGAVLYHFNFQKDIRSKVLNLFANIYNKMIEPDPADRPDIEEVIKFSVDLYNRMNRGKPPLSYAWNDLIPKPEIINFLDASKASAKVLINSWIKDEKTVSSYRRNALETLIKVIDKANSVDEIDKAMVAFENLDSVVINIRQNKQKADIAQAYVDYQTNPNNVDAIIIKLKGSIQTSSSMSKSRP